MKTFCLILALFLSSVFPLVAQSSSYISKDNHKGNWENGLTWTKQFSWMSNPPPPTNNINVGIRNYGYVTRNGNLSVSGGDGVFHIYDTLVITGNLSMSSGGTSAITVYNGGLLVVLGDFLANNNSTLLINVNSGGRVAILGDYRQLQGSITTTGAFYVFDDTPSFNWGSSVDGVNYSNTNNSATLGNMLEDENELQANDPPLWAFLGSLGAVTLPVELTALEGTPTTNGIAINWATASEKNSEKFIIERTKDAIHFEAIGEVASSGHSNTLKKYAFVDTDPLQSKSYYRLKSVDFDGSFEYSKLIAVSWNEIKPSFTVYPNPVTSGSFSFIIPGASDAKLEMSLVSSMGRVVHTQKLSQQDRKIELPQNIEKGIYLLVVQTPHGQQSTRLIVD